METTSGLAIIGILVATLLAYRKHRQDARLAREVQWLQYRREVGFPFDVVTGEDVFELASPGDVHAPPYVPRLEPSEQEAYHRSIDSRNVLLIGRTGSGKSREMFEAVRRIARERRGDLAVWMPRERLDAPDSAPSQAQLRRTVIILVDDINRFASHPEVSSDPLQRSVLERLDSLVSYARNNLAEYDVRFMVTLKYEASRGEVDLAWPGWERYEFKVIEPQTAENLEVRASFVRGLLEWYSIKADRDVVRLVAQRWDGTPLGLVTPLAAHAGTQFFLQQATALHFTYAEDWGRIFDREVKSDYRRGYVLEALAVSWRLGLSAELPLIRGFVARIEKLRTGLDLTREELDTLIDALRFLVVIRGGRAWASPAYLELVPLGKGWREAIVGEVGAQLGQSDLSGRFLRNIERLVRASESDPGLRDLVASLVEEAALRFGDLAEVWIDLSKIRTLVGDTLGAGEAARQALVCEEVPVEAYLELRAHLARTGLVAQEIEIAQVATERYPGSSRGWTAYGVGLSKLGRFSEAVEALEHAIELDPSGSRPQICLGRVLEAQAGKVTDEALALYIIATENWDLDPIAWRTLAIARDRLGDSDGAYEALVRAEARSWGVTAKASIVTELLVVGSQASMSHAEESARALGEGRVEVREAVRKGRMVLARKLSFKGSLDATRRAFESILKLVELSEVGTSGYEKTMFAASMTLGQLNDEETREGIATVLDILGLRSVATPDLATRLDSRLPSTWRILAWRAILDDEYAWLLNAASEQLGADTSIHQSVFAGAEELRNHSPGIAPEYLRVILGAAPRVAEYWNLLAVSEKDAQRYDDAVTAHLIALDYEPENPNFMYALGKTHLAGGDDRRAKDFLRQAAERGHRRARRLLADLPP